MKNLYIATLALVLFALCSCIDTADSTQENDTDMAQVHLAFSINSELHDGTPLTRTTEISNNAKDFNDRDINNLWVVQSVDGVVKVSKYFSSIQSTDIISNLVSGDSEIWFIANTGNSTLFSTVNTLEELKNKALTLDSSDPESNLAVDGCLRAVGCWHGNIEGNGSDYISVSLVPLAAKLTIDYEIIGAGEGYGFDNIQLINVPKSIHYCTTTGGTSTKDYVTTGYTAFTPNTENKQKGRLVYYVTENLPGISGVTNDDPRKKNLYGKDTKAMYLSIQGSVLFKSQEIPFDVSIYPGENNTNDFNVRINHNYHITLCIDASSGPNNWDEDCRITVNDIAIPTKGLQVRYEFSDDDKAGLNSMYESDGTTPLPNNGKYLRNLAKSENGNYEYSTDRLTYLDFDKNDARLPNQTFTNGTNYMSYSNCSINTMYGSELSSSDAFTIIYVGGCGKTNYNGWSVYGPTNYGNKDADPSGELDGRRWYLVVYKNGEFQYGSHSTLNTTIPNFKYIFDEDDPYTFFSADKNTPASGTKAGGKREILIDNITAQALDVSHYDFASNFYLGCNKWEPGWVTQGGHVYLFLIYNRTLSTEEINQIRVYALYKGFLRHPLAGN